MLFKVVIAVALLSLVGIAGFALYQQRHASHCASLEEAHLNGRSMMATSAALWATASAAERARINEDQEKLAEQLAANLIQIGEECGMEARRTADRKATEQYGF